MADDAEALHRDYCDAVFLPKTDFPMRAGLLGLEPRMLEGWGALETADRAAGVDPDPGGRYGG